MTCLDAVTEEHEEGLGRTSDRLAVVDPQGCQVARGRPAYRAGGLCTGLIKYMQVSSTDKQFVLMYGRKWGASGGRPEPPQHRVADISGLLAQQRKRRSARVAHLGREQLPDVALVTPG